MEVLQNNVMQSQSARMLGTNSRDASWLELFRQPRVFRPFAILIILFLFQQISGPYVIIFYAIDMFVKIGGTFGNVNEYGAMLMLGILRFIMAILCTL